MLELFFVAKMYIYNNKLFYMVCTYKFILMSEWPHMLCNSESLYFAQSGTFAIIDQLLLALI